MTSRDATNNEHALNPEAGDYWSDHLMPMLVVVEAGRFSVTFCEAKKPFDGSSLTWDLSKLTTLTRVEFNLRLRYKDASASLKDKTWAECWPRAHRWAVKAALEEQP